ncbi:MAG: aldo/keto reductase [Myxococcaceae bacterium]|nr:aldo/keto reductase [Myxococcaceae bacterium]
MKLLYGTAWKEDDTARCVRDALLAGYRGIDTANQRKHYHEAQVGQAIRGFPRDQLFLQTKFASKSGQDRRLPYDAAAPLSRQVEQSFQSSLEHLGTRFIDSYVLHGPSSREGWHPNDEEVWAAMEVLHQRGLAKALGVSNVSADQLELLCAKAKVQPKYVQNRCYARTGWDQRVRELCMQRGITYQGFSLLTANPEAVQKAVPIAAKHGVTPQQVIFAFALAVGMLPLTGTTDPQHMKEDLAAAAVQLTPDEVRLLQ